MIAMFVGRLRALGVYLVLAIPAAAATGSAYDQAIEMLRAGRFDEGVAALKDAATHDPHAANTLGEVLRAGAFGQARDNVAACDQFDVAARAGIALAQHNLGNCFFRGQGRPVDYARSRILYEDAIVGGSVKSLCALGNQYLRGYGVPADPQRAMMLCRQAAEQGDADAQADLGQMLLNPTVASPDYAQAAQWLARAAAQGQPNALLNLGIMHWNGDGVEKDPNRARDLLLRAAEAGHPKAYFHLGRLFFLRAADPERRIVHEDRAWIALFWLNLAAEQDPEFENRAEAERLRQVLAQASPPDVRERAASELVRWRAAKQLDP